MVGAAGRTEEKLDTPSEDGEGTISMLVDMLDILSMAEVGSTDKLIAVPNMLDEE